MEDTGSPLTTKPNYDHRDEPNDVHNLYELKKDFNSSLKLGKFRSVLKNLRRNRKDLIKSCQFGCNR